MEKNNFLKTLPDIFYILVNGENDFYFLQDYFIDFGYNWNDYIILTEFFDGEAKHNKLVYLQTIKYIKVFNKNKIIDYCFGIGKISNKIVENNVIINEYESKELIRLIKLNEILYEK